MQRSLALSLLATTLAAAADIQTTTFDTPHGRIQVHAPGARSSFSGLVVAEPAGKTDAERQTNAASLSGYVVEMDSQRSKVGAGIFRYIMPAAGAVTGMILLKDPAGQTVNSGHRLGQWDPDSTFPEYYPLWNMMPKPRMLVQSGNPVTVAGSFDGDLASTKANIGGQPARVLVETPHSAVLESPAGVTGPVDAAVSDAGQTYHQPVRMVRVQLSAPKTALVRGEQTTLSVRVSGLEGMDSGAELRLVNQSPSTVRMGALPTETISIEPSHVQAGGMFTMTRTLTGVKPGAFSLSAEVTGPVECSDDPCKDLQDALTAAGEAATAKETEARKKIVEAGELDKLAGKAKQGGPTAWEQEAAKNDAAAKKADADATAKAARGDAKGAAEATEAADKARAAAQDCRDTAKALKDKLVPDDNPKTPKKENAEAGKKLEGDADRLREEAEVLEAEAKKLRDEEKSLRKQLEKCRKDAEQKKKDAEKK